MRSLGFTKTGASVWNQMAELCCSCGLCTLYACPEDLYPKEACDKAKVEMKEAGIKFIQQKPVKVHPIKDGRRVPLKQLIMKLKLQEYDTEALFNPKEIKVKSVQIPLLQHIGNPSMPVVKKGEVAKEGQVIAEAVEGNLGANIHASIKGNITNITDKFITIET